MELQGRAFPETDMDLGLSKVPNEADRVGRLRHPSEEGWEAVRACGLCKAEFRKASEQFPLRGGRAVADEALHVEPAAGARCAPVRDPRCE